MSVGLLENEGGMYSQAKRQILFTLGMLVCGCLEAVVAVGLVGVRGAEGVAYSVVLCAVPGWLTIFTSSLLRQNDIAAYVVLIGTGFRVLFVFLGVFVVGGLRPDLGFREFTVWLIVGYMVALILETWLVLLPESVSGSPAGVAD